MAIPWLEWKLRSSFIDGPLTSSKHCRWSESYKCWSKKLSGFLTLYAEICPTVWKVRWHTLRKNANRHSLGQTPFPIKVSILKFSSFFLSSTGINLPLMKNTSPPQPFFEIDADDVLVGDINITNEVPHRHVRYCFMMWDSQLTTVSSKWFGYAFADVQLRQNILSWGSSSYPFLMWGVEFEGFNVSTIATRKLSSLQPQTVTCDATIRALGRWNTWRASGLKPPLRIGGLAPLTSMVVYVYGIAFRQAERFDISHSFFSQSTFRHTHTGFIKQGFDLPYWRYLQSRIGLWLYCLLTKTIECWSTALSFDTVNGIYTEQWVQKSQIFLQSDSLWEERTWLLQEELRQKNGAAFSLNTKVHPGCTSAPY